MRDLRRGKWETDRAVYDPLNHLLRFQLDAAASHDNALCPTYFTEEDNALRKQWLAASVWCNPPYGRATGDWVEYGRTQAFTLRNRVTMLLPVKADARWYHRFVWGRNRVVDSAVLGGPLPGRWYRLEEREGFVELLELLGRKSFGDTDGPGFFASAVVLYNSGRTPVLPQLEGGKHVKAVRGVDDDGAGLPGFVPVRGLRSRKQRQAAHRAGGD